MLRNGGATTRTTVPVSAGLLSDTDAYYDALTAYRSGDPNPIIEEFSRAAFAAVRNGQQLATDLRTLHDGWANNLRARRDAVAWRVLPFLLRQPSVTSKLVQDTFKVTQPAADNALRQLQEAGALSKPRTVHGAGRSGTSSGRPLRSSKLSTGSASGAPNLSNRLILIFFKILICFMLLILLILSLLACRPVSLTRFCPGRPISDRYAARTAAVSGRFARRQVFGSPKIRHPRQSPAGWWALR